NEIIYKPAATSGENIYYIILDGLVSYDYFLEITDDKSNTFGHFDSKLQKLDFKLYPNSRASYNLTYLTLGSILEMNYYNQDLVYKNRDEFFPKVLYQKKPPPLLANLNNIGYEFIYSGNFWAQCRFSENFSCANRAINRDSFTPLDKLVYFTNNAGIQTLTSRSTLGFLIRRASSSFGTALLDDGLENFLNSGIDLIKPRTKKFYFIHNEAPHPPYPNKNCKIDPSQSYTTWGSEDDYSFAVSCALDKTMASIDRIMELDPTAIIVLQGDHGASMNYDWMANPLSMTKESLIERFSIYNAIRAPQKCHAQKFDALGNVETINLVFNCISNNNPTEVINKSFAAVYEENRELFGRLYEVTGNIK
ncbi:hypothetical protein OAB24_04755, partial [Gammaproteobacteria bacterium]|nr:hypothetical protein [Gammaproteobacteria bacterium]